MICQTRKPKQQTFPISFHHPIGSVMSLLSQLSYESSKTELVKKQPAARGKKIFQPKKKPAQRGRKKVSGRPDSSSPWWRCVGGGGVLEVFLRPPTGLVKAHRQPETCMSSGVCRRRRSRGDHRARCVIIYFFSVVWIEPVESGSLWQRWPRTNPLCRVFHNKRALTKKVRLVAEWRAFDRPVNRYKWFNTLGHFSRC